jgi:hypothetical protein
MTNQDILISAEMGTVVELSHECKVYNRIDHGEVFRIERVNDESEHVVVLDRYGDEYKSVIVSSVIVVNQYGQEHKVKPSELVEMEIVKNYNY